MTPARMTTLGWRRRPPSARSPPSRFPGLKFLPRATSETTVTTVTTEQVQKASRHVRGRPWACSIGANPNPPPSHPFCRRQHQRLSPRPHPHRHHSQIWRRQSCSSLWWTLMSSPRQRAPRRFLLQRRCSEQPRSRRGARVCSKRKGRSPGMTRSVEPRAGTWGAADFTPPGEDQQQVKALDS